MAAASREQQIKDLLMDALDRGPLERESFVSAEAADPSIRMEVLGLIDAHERAGDFMSDLGMEVSDGAAARADSMLEETGSIIDRYQLVHLLGEGGFGRVYLAEQRTPVVRQVALKIIKLGMDTRQVIARFEAERQALAMMEHPSIARVIDAGATAAGRPYFVMELVRGVPITQYCDEHRLSVAQRLDLFIQVCAAVQHAHMKGVIHRDIKPSNVLVMNHVGPPLPKVIDFGIAKATGVRLTDKTIVTEIRQLIGTPEYMSPEQADVNTADVDTRADVYSLGVLLYELLTGATPFDGERLRSSTFGEMQRIIREEEPLRPSTSISRDQAAAKVTQQRGCEPRRLATQLRGDLDWIALKAIEKNRDRRYSSAAELADDLQRHLRHEPVVARPPGAAYRLRKFIRRHRMGVAATTLVALAMIGGVAGTTMGMLRSRESARQARDAADQAEQINRFMREVLTSVDPDTKGADVALVEVLDDASTSASQRFAEHPELEAQVREMLATVYMRLYKTTQAEQEYRQAAALWHDLFGPDDPRTLSAVLGVGLALSAQERPREAEQYLGDILPRLERAFGPTHEQTFLGYSIVANILRSRGRLAEGERMIKDALERARVARAQGRTQLLLLNTQTGILGMKINAVEQQSGWDAAVDEYMASARQMLDLAARENSRGQWFIRAARGNYADIAFRKGAYAEAASQCQIMLDESSKALGECHNHRVAAMVTLARSLNQLGNAHDAAHWYLHAIDCTRTSLGSDNINLLAFLCDALAILDRDARWADGERCVREILPLLQRLASGHIGAFTYEAYLAHFVSKQGRIDEAQVMFDSLLTRTGEAADRREAMRLELAYAGHLVRLQRFEEAQQRLRAFELEIDIRRGITAEYPEEFLVTFGELYEAWGKPDLAQTYTIMRQEALTAPSSD